MILAFVAIAAIWLVYHLFVIGTLWRIALFLGGWVGIYLGLSIYLPESKATTVIFDHPFSWAAVIATGICLMGMLTTKSSS